MRGFTEIGDGFTEIGDGFTEISDEFTEIGGEFTEIDRPEAPKASFERMPGIKRVAWRLTPTISYG